jgi:hypothetical protein
MHIVFPEGPPGGIECVTSFFQATFEQGVLAKLSRTFSLNPKQARISSALQAYFLDQEVLQDTETICEARLGMWQYLIFSANSPVTDVGVVQSEGKLSVSHMRGDGTIAESAVQAILLAEAVEAEDAPEYEFRLLRAPCVRFVGAWLHHQDADVVIPIGHTSTPGLAVQKFYTGKEVLDFLKAEHRAISALTAVHA